MQLDKTRIAIRERPFLDILDLALHVIRAHAEGLVAAWLAGAVPLALLDFWLLSRIPLAANTASDGSSWSFLWYQIVLMVWEIPLATAPISLFLGQALFIARPSSREIARQFITRLPQLIVLQVLFRGVFAAPAVFGCIYGLHPGLLVLINFVMLIVWFLAYVFRPYLNEILLLERNPLRKRSKQDISTLSRARSMHSFASGDLFIRWMMAFCCGVVMTLALWLAMLAVRGMLTAHFEFDRAGWMLFLPAAGWVAIGYLAVVRFLAYLDLRIRSEGWEVELLLRAEGARLERHLV